MNQSFPVKNTINDLGSEAFMHRTDAAYANLKSSLWGYFKKNGNHTSEIWNEISQLIKRSDNIQSEDGKFRIPQQYTIVAEEDMSAEEHANVNYWKMLATKEDNT